jgi:MFS family permease
MKYGFDEDEAGKLIAIPYYISAGFSPIFGYTVDKIGRRVIFITISSIILICAFTLSMLVPSCGEQKCHYEVYPLVLIGFGYSLYASVIWGSIPYTVDASTVGTAFGIVTAI